MGTSVKAVVDLVSNCEVAGLVPYQAPLVHTAEEFQAEQNSCPVLPPVFGFQIYWLIMNF